MVHHHDWSTVERGRQAGASFGPQRASDRCVVHRHQIGPTDNRRDVEGQPTTATPVGQHGLDQHRGLLGNRQRNGVEEHLPDVALDATQNGGATVDATGADHGFPLHNENAARSAAAIRWSTA
jgi:hypothetical protein